jgi:hypothetical protein
MWMFFFHISQCIFRKVQDCGLQTEYREQDFNTFTNFICILVALAFVSANDFVHSNETLLEAHAPASAQTLINYFEDTCIGHLTRRNGYGECICQGIRCASKNL